MPVRLYTCSQRSYEAAASLLACGGKAAAIHPTGADKNSIAFKLIKGNPMALGKPEAGRCRPWVSRIL